MAKVATIFPLFFTSCLCQFSMDFGMKPDVTFGEHNDRFDVASIVQEQSRMTNTAVESDDEYRRHLTRKDNEQKVNEEIKKELDKDEELLDALKDTVDSLHIKDFAYHRELEGTPDNKKNPTVLEGKRRSLQRIVDYLHGGLKSGRRGMSPDPEDEILFHYGVPINMKIEGFVEVPLEKS